MSDLTQPSCFSRFFSKKSSNKTEVEIIEPVTMELYIKAGPEDGQVGDCPFAHYVRCVMHFKGLDCKVIPCKPETKPEWLLNDPDLNGKMPCLKKDDFKLVSLQKLCFRMGNGAARHRSALCGTKPCRVMTHHNKSLIFKTNR